MSSRIRWFVWMRLLVGPVAALSPPVREWLEDRPLPDPRRLEGLTPEEREALRHAETRERNARQLALKAWLYQSMLASEAPLIERMTLFWHNHFTSEARAVRLPQLMLRQHLEWRRLALGNDAELLRAVATDPAMLIDLDGRRNRKTRPNENFARELLELFTLGEGHYGEADVQADVQAAVRALSGWTLDPASGTARFDLRRHDDGVKALLGRSGHWGLDGILAIL